MNFCNFTHDSKIVLQFFGCSNGDECKPLESTKQFSFISIVLCQLVQTHFNITLFLLIARSTATQQCSSWQLIDTFISIHTRRETNTYSYFVKRYLVQFSSPASAKLQRRWFSRPCEATGWEREQNEQRLWVMTVVARKYFASFIILGSVSSGRKMSTYKYEAPGI